MARNRTKVRRAPLPPEGVDAAYASVRDKIDNSVWAWQDWIREAIPRQFAPHVFGISREALRLAIKEKRVAVQEVRFVSGKSVEFCRLDDLYQLGKHSFERKRAAVGRLREKPRRKKNIGRP